MLTLACINFALQGRHFINEDKRRILDWGKANKTDIMFCLNSLNTSANECNHFWRLPYSTFKSGQNIQMGNKEMVNLINIEDQNDLINV